MPATAKKLTEAHTSAAAGEVVYLPNAKLPEEKISAPHPWDSPTYKTDQQQAQMLMLALAQLDQKQETRTTNTLQAQQTVPLIDQWQPILQPQQRGVQLNITDEERAAKQAEQMAAQYAMMAPRHG